MEINFGFAMLLTTIAGLSTGIGSAIAFFIRRPKYSYLSFLLGLSAGVMVYISFTELLGTAIKGFLPPSSIWARFSVMFISSALYIENTN